MRSTMRYSVGVVGSSSASPHGCLGATGGYGTALVAVLAGARLPVVVTNPRQVRDFARATGQLARTDRLDTQLLARPTATSTTPSRRARSGG
ncbi:MAG: transposase [Acidobacteria bacterium]|nr:transposase [Acidobacteriota bacterium]